MKRVRSEEDGSGSGDENCAGTANKRARTEAEPAKPRTVTVFGKEVSVEELEAVRTKQSRNIKLGEEADLAAADRYFLKAEAKDAIEQKMLETKSVAVKAVSCLTCNYTDFKAVNRCNTSY